jgi:hypothetical protein
MDEALDSLIQIVAGRTFCSDGKTTPSTSQGTSSAHILSNYYTTVHMYM